MQDKRAVEGRVLSCKFSLRGCFEGLGLILLTVDFGVGLLLLCDKKVLIPGSERRGHRSLCKSPSSTGSSKSLKHVLYRRWMENGIL